jgi:hypothetical protein
MSKPQKGPAPKDKRPGNITVDLGEAIDKKLRAAIGSAKSEARASVGGSRSGAFGRRPMFGGGRFGRPVLGGGFGRPVSGGFRPFYGSRFSSPSLGGSMLTGVQRQTNTLELLAGAGVGVVGNRALMRVTPSLTFLGSSALVHSSVAFVVGLIPALIRQNSVTVGVAIPGAVVLAGALVDYALNAMKIGQPALSGANQNRQGIDAAMAARQRLADITARLSPARPAAVQSGAQRAYATAK